MASRRAFVLAILLVLGACNEPVDLRTEPPPRTSVEDGAQEGADGLGATPTPDVSQDSSTGLQQLPAAGEGSLLFVPTSYRPGTPMPFALTLHGCCSEAKGGLNLWYRLAKRHGVILLAPDGGGSWSGAEGRIDAGLEQVFSRYAVDPDRIAVVGFSAGASYALTLGLANGDLFTHVVAHSPGSYYHLGARGKPEVFVAHGVKDQTIPVSVSRDIVPELRRDEYKVRYVEYPLGHRPQPHIMARAVRWFLD